MILVDAKKLALQLMVLHGLLKPEVIHVEKTYPGCGYFRYDEIKEPWKFKWSDAKCQFGTCSYQRRTISLSRPLTELNAEAEVRDTILHEIAHALAGPKAGHRKGWKIVAAAIGARPERCYSKTAVKTPERKWSLQCPNCGSVSFARFHKRSHKRIFCRMCCRRYNNGIAHERFLFKYVLTSELEIAKIGENSNGN